MRKRAWWKFYFLFFEKFGVISVLFVPATKNIKQCKLTDKVIKGFFLWSRYSLLRTNRADQRLPAAQKSHKTLGVFHARNPKEWPKLVLLAVSTTREGEGEREILVTSKLPQSTFQSIFFFFFFGLFVVNNNSKIIFTALNFDEEIFAAEITLLFLCFFLSINSVHKQIFHSIFFKLQNDYMNTQLSGIRSGVIANRRSKKYAHAVIKTPISKAKSGWANCTNSLCSRCKSVSFVLLF